MTSLVPAALDVAVFLTPSDSIDADRVEAYRALLSPEEHTRSTRFVFERDRRQYIVTRALVRTVLSELRPAVGPAAWRFVIGEFGRPELSPEHDVDLRFNVSHTRGAVVLALSTAERLGVDIEAIDRGLTLDDVSPVLAPAELARLRRTDVDRLPSELMKYWTLKEAYVKALGSGLSDDIRQIELELTPAITVKDTRSPDVGGWFFALQAAPGGHVLALAVQSEGRSMLRLSARRRIPLGDDAPIVLGEVL